MIQAIKTILVIFLALATAVLSMLHLLPLPWVAWITEQVESFERGKHEPLF